MLISPTLRTMTDSQPRLSHFFLLLLLAFVWGSSFILMKRALFTSEGEPLFSAFQVGAARIFIAGLVLSPVAIRHLPKMKRAHIGWMLAVGILGNTIPAFLFTGAQLRLPSSMAGMLNALTPLFTLIVATLVFKLSYRRIQLIGLAIGFAGAMGLIQLRTGGGELHVPSALMVVLATICYAFSVNILRNRLQEVNSTVIAAGALGMMAIPTGLWLLFSQADEVFQVHKEAAVSGALAVVVLAAIGTAASLVVFNRIIQQTSALFASSVTYVIPVFAAMWGLLDGEELTLLHLVFAGVVLSGVYLVNSSHRKV